MSLQSLAGMSAATSTTWNEEASLQRKLHQTQYGDLPPHSTGVQGAFARAMGRHSP